MNEHKEQARLDVEYLAKEIKRLAYNIWWTWNPRAQSLFETLAPHTWEKSRHNAVAVIKALSDQELGACLHGPLVGPFARSVIDDFENYLSDKNTWAHFHAPQLLSAPIAYFSAEFGLHESLPIYSGGLGILSGDHTKSASDLGLPLIAVGLFYRHGYFNQRIDENGWQREVYPSLDPDLLPMERVLDASGEPVTVRVVLAHTEVTVGAWRVNVGRNPLYLLDTNFPQNEEHWRDITSRVYGGDAMTRIGQELILGVAGARFLRTLGHQPSVYHMNEGHSAFLILELLKTEIEKGLTYAEAADKVREKTIFTTHTPVGAGHDRFSADLLNHMMNVWPERFGMSFEQFMGLGRVNPDDAHEPFCMTVLALKHSRAANAVSELNGEVSRKMWIPLHERNDAKVPPIGSITNGVHVLGWMNKITYEFWEKTLGPQWLKHLKQSDFWEKIADEDFLTDEAIWGLRYRLKRQLIEHLGDRIVNWERRAGIDFTLDQPLNPDALIIGFSRRFATYKRATLLFRDLDRAENIFNNPNRPVQIIFAGKAHPRDDAAKGYLQQIFHLSRDRRFLGKIFVLEGYDIQLARLILSGIDVLLNTPRRPLEACGTSGQKIAVHGGLNLSIMDGWWREGFDGHNGFAIGPDEHIE
ncbi:alpha-glucan family phosphorylase, partial [Candidatus Sumerlaeota bacterium]|nr:alpha-glucan family phosphorylase [Candidatus Sumerlaeota bacterium]